MTNAPLYCATSSPSTKTLGSDSSSSANASFRASLTATSLVPLGVAYVLLPVRIGNGKVGWTRDFVGALQDRGVEKKRETGRKRREAIMTREVISGWGTSRLDELNAMIPSWWSCVVEDGALSAYGHYR